VSACPISSHPSFASIASIIAPGETAMRKLFLIAVFVALPVTMLAQQENPTKEQKEYFARQIELFAQHLASRADSEAWIDCDSVVASDCQELLARSLERRNELLVWHSYDQCAPLTDFEKLVCLNKVSVLREQRMNQWRREWRPTSVR